jgi:DNA invertase Pin-like site-specific DNA recombinase
MSFAGVKIVTLSEGEIGQLHVGLKGTMNALFLKDLADKTRRGLQGRVEAGKSGGGNSYGYDAVKHITVLAERARRSVGTGVSTSATPTLSAASSATTPAVSPPELSRSN